MYDLIYTPPIKAMLLSGCSLVTTAVAEAANMWNLLVVRINALVVNSSSKFLFSYPTVPVHQHSPIASASRHCSERIRPPIYR